MGLDHVDFRMLLETAPDPYLILAPDPPQYTVIAVTDAYSQVTMTRREEIVGHGLFEVFADLFKDEQATSVQKLRGSLKRVLQSAHQMPCRCKSTTFADPIELGGSVVCLVPRKS